VELIICECLKEFCVITQYMLYMSVHGYIHRHIHTWTHTYIHAYTYTYIHITHTYMHTPNSVGILWTSDQPVAETSTWQHTTRTEDRHALSGIRTRSPSKRAAADLRLRPRGHRSWPNFSTFSLNSTGDVVITKSEIKIYSENRRKHTFRNFILYFEITERLIFFIKYKFDSLL